MHLTSRGHTVVAGRATKDAEFSFVGDRRIAKCRFGLAVERVPGGQSTFANCVAWRGLAEQAKAIQKGDSVLVAGIVEENEYGGKTYKNIVADFLMNCGTTYQGEAPQSNASAAADDGFRDAGEKLPWDDD